MEKLIELVVKCQKELKQGYPLWDIEGAIKNSKEILISKSFGFIKRLVDNKKINFEKFDGDNYDYLENPIGSNNYDTVWDYKTIIQWLSISDTPIEDLILYLK